MLSFDQIETQLRLAHGSGPWKPDGLSLADLSEHLGVTVRTVSRYRATGLTAKQADRMACAIGLVPQQLWGLDWCELVD